MENYIGRIVLLVDDYETAAGFYETNFGFRKIHDVSTDVGQRFLHLGTGTLNMSGIWLLKADSKEQKALIGRQTGGQPTMVIYTESAEDLYAKLKGNNVKVKVEPVTTPGYIFFHCLDLCGNEIVVVEIKK